MLNTFPDTRGAEELAGGLLKPNKIVALDLDDAIEDQDNQMTHEAIDLDERRKSSVHSSKSDSMSSVEVPKRNATVDMGKKIFFNFFRNTNFSETDG
jgi:hypothetical protein